jgi:hypothetical protein
MTNTLVPTATPPIIGIINSLESVNIREGPDVSFSAFVALNPGTGVQVIGQNEDGTWYEVELDDGDRGWVFARLLRLESTATPFPTFTPSPDLTALALGTPLPTAILGGGTVTPTPPAAITTPTAESVAANATDDNTDDVEVAAQSDGGPTPTESFLPIRDVTALYQTATALAGGSLVTPRPTLAISLTPSPTGQSPNVPAPTPVNSATPAPSSANTNNNATVSDGIDVFALCNNPAFGVPAPSNLAAGSTIDIYWAWFMAASRYIEEHLAAVAYDVRINDEPLEWRQFGLPVRQEGNSWVKYWYVPYGPLAAGDYIITFRTTWSEAISDGYEQFGPGTANPIEEGSCTFTVR